MPRGGLGEAQGGVPSFAPAPFGKKNLNFLKCRPPKSLDKEKPIDMNLAADHRISETGDFDSELALFPASFEFESRGEQTPSRLTRDQMDAFLAASDNARSAHFFTPAPEPPAATPEKGLAAGVLKQAAHDLRRFRTATKGVKRELYLDAYGWITANDFSWPYSFVNVCKLLDVSPEVVRTEIFADASLGLLDYWTRRAGRLSGKLRASFARVFVSCRNPECAEADQLASSI
jgi:hypothetical protein